MNLFYLIIYSCTFILVGYYFGKQGSFWNLKQECQVQKQERRVTTNFTRRNASKRISDASHEQKTDLKLSEQINGGSNLSCTKQVLQETTNWIDVDINDIFEQKCPLKMLDWEEFKIKILKNNSIYEVVPDDFGPLDLDQNWKDLRKYIYQILEKVAKTAETDFIRIIEVGSFKGLSTSFIGEACSNITEVYGKTCQIICVDTWLGSPEFYEFFGIDEPRNEYAHDLFLSFLNNMKLKGLDNIVYPLRLPSQAAAHILHCYQILADVVFIDADHDYNAVVKDIQLYYPLVRKDGIFMGHDYDWKDDSAFNLGVKQAVQEFLEKKKSLVNFWDKVIYFFMLKEQEEATFFNKRTKNLFR